jgi:hypothetical protein
MHRLVDLDPLATPFLVKGSVRLQDMSGMPFVCLMYTVARHNIQLSDPMKPAVDVKRWLGDVKCYWYSLN